MSKQSHHPNQAQDHKAKDNQKASSKKQHPTPQELANQTQPIHPSVLQQALENPPAARPETILQLQRRYGNRAVGQLLEQQVVERPQPQVNSPAQGSTQSVQRLLDFEFTADVGFVAGTFKEHDKDFKTIMEDYKEYKKSKTPEEENTGLTNLITLIQIWLQKHGQKYAGSRKVMDLTGLKQACEVEKTKVEYLIKMEKGQFKYITSSGSSAHRLTPAEQKFATENKLTRGELAAIKVYTGGDYKYINPTLLGNEGWLDASVKAMTGPTKANISGKEVAGPSVWMGKSWLEEMKKNGPTAEQKEGIKQEAKEHSSIAKMALNKLPDVKETTTYRGMALSKEQIEREYQQGKPVSHNLFISTSNKTETALNFARENSTGGKIGIFFTIKVKKGKDVTMFSEAKSEGEILLLPNAIFIVDEIHKPDATDNFYRIKMTQTS